MWVFSLVFPYFMEFYPEGQAILTSGVMEIDDFGLLMPG
jgi:hypothetical protein